MSPFSIIPVKTLIAIGFLFALAATRAREGKTPAKR